MGGGNRKAFSVGGDRFNRKPFRYKNRNRMNHPTSMNPFDREPYFILRGRNNQGAMCTTTSTSRKMDETSSMTPRNRFGGYWNKAESKFLSVY